MGHKHLDTSNHYNNKNTDPDHVSMHVEDSDAEETQTDDDEETRQHKRQKLNNASANNNRRGRRRGMDHEVVYRLTYLNPKKAV